MGEAFIVDACRTPRGVGKKGKGALAHLHPHVLAATVLRAIAERNALDTAEVDDVIFGTSYQRGDQANDLARMALLQAGFDIRASGVTLDRFCGSGITSVALAAAQVKSGAEDLVIAGGAEMMSYSGAHADPTVPPMLDTGNLSLRNLHPQSHQGVCADFIATMEGVDRAAADRVAYVSQQRASKAIQEGRFTKSLVPVLNQDGSLALDREEFVRPDTSMETLGALKTVFDKWTDLKVDDQGATYGSLIRKKYPQLTKVQHVHHAGNSSGVVDGAAAILLASESYVRRANLKPRGRVVATANIGDCPTLMLNAPVPAARKVLRKANLSIDEIDLFEINEAFAVVAEKFVRDLGLDWENVNVNGGSIALGHPIGATGAILIGTALDELERRDARYALVTMCAAGGMAPAIIIERLN